MAKKTTKKKKKTTTRKAARRPAKKTAKRTASKKKTTARRTTTRKTAAKAKPAGPKKITASATPRTRSQQLTAIAESCDMTRKEVMHVFDSLEQMCVADLKKSIYSNNVTSAQIDKMDEALENEFYYASR